MNRIETERLLIRRFKPDDWRDLYEYLSDKEVVKYEPYDVFSAEECIAEAARRAEDPAFWAVCLREGGKLIGNIYLTEAEPEFSRWELGYVFNRQYQGKGYASEASAAMVSHAFMALGALRVVAMCDPLNTASWRLMERLGMRREAHKLKNVFFWRDAQGNPIWKDTYEYAVLAEEWKSRLSPHRTAAVRYMRATTPP
jgi:[ribosomal protein S5]-alanine N-acetyltransferase